MLHKQTRTAFTHIEENEGLVGSKATKQMYFSMECARCVQKLPRVRCG